MFENQVPFTRFFVCGQKVLPDWRKNLVDTGWAIKFKKEPKNHEKSPKKRSKSDFLNTFTNTEFPRFENYALSGRRPLKKGPHNDLI